MTEESGSEIVDPKMGGKDRSMEDISRVLDTSDEIHVSIDEINISSLDSERTAPVDRPANPLHADSREQMFQQAINLMSERCPSMAQREGSYSRGGRTPLLSGKATPAGTVTTKYFYVNQKKPTPMAPLKAWRGYHGNVYFEPIRVGQAPEASEKDKDTPRDKIPENCSPTLKQILESKHKYRKSRSAMRSFSALESSGGRVGSPGRLTSGGRSRTAMELRHTSLSRASNKTARSSNYSYTAGPRQMSILDKAAILDRENDKIREDLNWVINQESTGSLCIAPMPRNKHELRKPATSSSSVPNTTTRNTENSSSSSGGGSHTAASLDKEKICRGSVAHKIYAMKNQRIPLLSVSGDKLQQSSVPSPLMRTQTQYSQSSQRMTMNSPDLYHMAMMQGYDAKLQPLEQLKASLKQIEHSGNPGDAVFTIPAMERIRFEDPDLSLKKPYVKYTAEVKNSMKRTTQIHRNNNNNVQKVK